MTSSAHPKRWRILVATDFSTPADEAIRQAHAWAAGVGGELIVCHVVPSPPPTNLLFPQRNEQDALRIVELERMAAEYLERRVVELTERAPDTFAVVVDSGVPEAVIVEAAEENHADAVVIGNRGATGMARLPVGTIAARVLRFAHCSVLLARPYKATGRVVAATDLSDPSLPAVHAGLIEARRRGAKLTVVHNVDTSPILVPPLESTMSSAGLTPLPPTAPPMSAPEEILERARRHLREVMDAHHVEGECIITEGEPSKAVVHLADEKHAELLVIGTHGRTGLMRIALGSTAERIVEATSCPVLVVRLATGAPPRSSA